MGHPVFATRNASILPFEQHLENHGLTLKRPQIKTLQINLGRVCNQTCNHCHVEAGPNRKESMAGSTVLRIVALLSKASGIEMVDITGGAPELNPHFRQLVESVRTLGKKVLVRCNLTVLLEPGQEDTIQFFKTHQIEVISSLPCYTKENVDKQRGRNVFDRSLTALRRLNEVGYGVEGSGLTLNLVYNPGGPFLPGAQDRLELQYKQRLMEDFGIVYNQLFTITNMPIKRFERSLHQSEGLDAYYQLLFESFNPMAAKNVMCTSLLSVGWDGKLFDCDFNQALEIPVVGSETIDSIQTFEELSPEIVTNHHCYGCTAGAGSSCGGALD